MSSSRSIVSVQAIGLRVAAQPTYIPAHSKNGVNVDSRLLIRAISNVASRANQGKGETNGFNLIAWGKLADSLAKTLSVGKEFHAVLTPHTYRGRVFVANPKNPKGPAVPLTMQTPEGVKFVETEKVIFRIERIVLGADSAATIAKEIQEGTRPADWAVAGSPGAQAWAATIERRRAMQYDPNLPVFGYALVRKPEGPGIGPYNPEQRRAAGVAAAVAAAVASAPAAQPVQAPATALVAGL